MRTRTTLLAVVLFSLSATFATAQSGTLSATDYFEIQQLYARYNYAFDSSDPEMVATVFTPDGELVTGSNRRKGREIVKGPARPQPRIRHIATSVMFNASSEGARGKSYVLLVDMEATPPVIIRGGSYEDVLVKTPQGWRFKQRSFYSTPPAPEAAPSQGSTR